MRRRLSEPGGVTVTSTTRNADDDANFELSFSPNARLVSTVRRFVSSFYADALESADFTSQLALAAHELLENAVRYSADSKTSIRIGIKRTPSGVRATIETHNRAPAASIASLRAMVDEIAAAPDPDAHYQLLMRRSAKRTDGSGLGLGRVRAEGGMAISCQIDNDAVRVRAQSEFPVPSGVGKP
jgi:hypothetical protein